MTLHQTRADAFDRDTADKPRVPFSEGLLRAANEARLLSQEAAHLDDTIGVILARYSQTDARGLQNADLLRQGLEGLADFLTGLVETIDVAGTCCPSEAAAALRMQEQSRRLGDKTISDTVPDNTTAGEIWG
ncbi:hypothetical protein [Roseinatronobacter sp. NSM]|uniref:hypothetical protein n=1 Tax=Roseinatronobacter sp. NSM TaxID=3457785 RepID=UPI0040351BC6